MRPFIRSEKKIMKEPSFTKYEIITKSARNAKTAAQASLLTGLPGSGGGVFFFTRGFVEVLFAFAVLFLVFEAI
jgi:hypothetical protein